MSRPPVFSKCWANPEKGPSSALNAPEACDQTSPNVFTTRAGAALEGPPTTESARSGSSCALIHHTRESISPDCNSYDRFTEGFDTADLKDAKALRDQPSSLTG